MIVDYEVVIKAAVSGGTTQQKNDAYECFRELFLITLGDGCVFETSTSTMPDFEDMALDETGGDCSLINWRMWDDEMLYVEAHNADVIARASEAGESGDSDDDIIFDSNNNGDHDEDDDGLELFPITRKLFLFLSAILAFGAQYFFEFLPNYMRSNKVADSNINKKSKKNMLVDRVTYFELLSVSGLVNIILLSAMIPISFYFGLSRESLNDPSKLNMYVL